MTQLSPRHRLILFGSPYLRKTPILVEAFLRAVENRQDIEVVAICDTGLRTPLPWPFFTIDAWCRRFLIWLFNPSLRAKLGPLVVRNIYNLGRAFGIPIIVPPQRNVNHPAFAVELREKWRPTMALSLGCEQIFRASLLSLFEWAVNCHSSCLPDYRGVASTEWSLYYGEKQTGYTFHLMTASVDGGSILVQNAIPVAEEMTFHQVDQAKWMRASRDAATVLDLMLTRQAGEVQAEGGSVFRFADLQRVRKIDDVAELTEEELRRRLRCFSTLRIEISGVTYPVTAVRESRSDSSRLLLVTSDGRKLVPHRTMHLPVPMYRLARNVSHLQGKLRFTNHD